MSDETTEAPGAAETPSQKGKRGKKWESKLGRWHWTYKRRRMAFMFRCHPGSRFWAGRMIANKKGAPDFCGVVQGMFICFDAKEWKHKLALPFAKIRPHQAEHFDMVRAQGGLAFVAVNFTAEGGGMYAVPWTRGLSSLYKRWLNKEKLPRGVPNLTPDMGIQFFNGTYDFETGVGEVGGWIRILPQLVEVLADDLFPPEEVIDVPEDDDE